MNSFKSMPKAKLQKIVLVIIVTLVVLGAMGNFWIAKQWSDWSSHRDEIATLGTQIDVLQTSANQEASNTEVRDQIKAFVEEQHQRMVSGDPFSWVVREMSLLAEKHPVRLTGMRPGDTAPSAQQSKYNVFVTHLEVEGTYDQVGVFIKDLENYFATSQIRSLEMFAPDPTKSLCRVSLECALPILPVSAATSPVKPTEESKT
jgi:hypothetical protein